MNKALKDIRSERGLLSAIARKLKLTPAAVSHWDKVPDRYLNKVAKFTGITKRTLRPDLFR